MSASAMKCNPPPAHTPFTATIVGSHTSLFIGVSFNASATLSDLGTRNDPRSANPFEIHAHAKATAVRRNEDGPDISIRTDLSPEIREIQRSSLHLRHSAGLDD